MLWFGAASGDEAGRQGGHSRRREDNDYFLTGGKRKGGSTKAGSFLQLKM